MITEIAEIGKFVEEDVISEPITAKQVFAFKFRYKNKTEMVYEGISLEEVKEKDKYLYRKDLSGKPGLFLSWKISSNDIKNLKSAIESNDAKSKDKINKFKRT